MRRSLRCFECYSSRPVFPLGEGCKQLHDSCSILSDHSRIIVTGYPFKCKLKTRHRSTRFGLRYARVLPDVSIKRRKPISEVRLRLYAVFLGLADGSRWGSRRVDANQPEPSASPTPPGPNQTTSVRCEHPLWNQRDLTRPYISSASSSTAATIMVLLATMLSKLGLQDLACRQLLLIGALPDDRRLSLEKRLFRHLESQDSHCLVNRIE